MAFPVLKEEKQNNVYYNGPANGGHVLNARK